MKPSQQPNRRTVPIAFWGVAIFTLVCVGAAILLSPDETQVMKRLTADGKIQRLREIVAEKIGSEPDDWELIQHAATEFGRGGWDVTATQAMQRLVANIDDPAVAFAAMNSIENVIPTEAVGTIYSGLAARSLALTNPALAADIFQRVGKLSGMSERLTADLITSLRGSSQSGEALSVLVEFKERNGGELPAIFDELFDTLALESGELGAAFASAREKFEKGKGRDPAVLRAAIDKLIKVGSHAGRTGELIPLCDEYLAGLPAGKLTWQEIIKIREGEPEFDDPEFRRVASEAAEFCRWNNQPDKAFDYLRKLAALGSMDALDQCVALHLPLLRESDLVDLLDAFIPSDERPELTLLAAQIHAKRTDYIAADTLFHLHLTDRPDDALAWAELGGMWDAAGDFERALDAYRNGITANPDDEELKVRIARTLVSMGDYEGALERYAQMGKYDRKVLTSYLTLASNLGDKEATLDGLLKWFSLPRERHPIDYARLAQSYAALGRDEKMIEVYRKGIEAFGSDRELRIELARELNRLQRHSEVMAVIDTPELRDDPEAMSLHLSSCLASKQYRAGRSFAGEDAEHRMELPISAKLPLAEIYYQTGSVSKSDALYSSIPESEMPAITKATLAYRKNKFSEAKTLLNVHLASEKNDHKAWSFLGSIHRIERNNSEAESAYERALSLLTTEMNRRASGG